MAELSEAQVLALADIAEGVPDFIQANTAASLRRLGLTQPSGLTAKGRAALADAKQKWPAMFRYAEGGEGR